MFDEIVKRIFSQLNYLEGLTQGCLFVLVCNLSGLEGLAPHTDPGYK